MNIVISVNPYIDSDSSILPVGLSLWLPKWRQNGFKTATGAPVKNAGLIRYLSALLDARALYGQQVRFQYVKGHSGEEGNEGADAQANKGTLLSAVPERDWDALELELREQMEIEQANRSDGQPVVPMEVEADDSPTGNAMKARKVSGDGSPLAPAGYEAKASSTDPLDLLSTPNMNTPPPAAPELSEPPSPLKAKELPAQQFDALSTPKAKTPKAAGESMSLAACSLPKPGFAKPSTSSSPRKAAASTSRTQAMIAALWSPSSTVESTVKSNPADPALISGPATVTPSTPSPGKLATAKSKTEAIIAALRTPTKRSPRRAAPSSKVASVLRPFVPSKSTSTDQQTNTSPSKAMSSPTKMQSRLPVLLGGSPSKTVYSKEPTASSSSLMDQLTEADESQPSQGTQSTIAESFVTALTTIIPTTPIDAPSVEPAHAASHIDPSLSEQPAMDVSSNDPTKIVVNKEDIDLSVCAFNYFWMVSSNLFMLARCMPIVFWMKKMFGRTLILSNFIGHCSIFCIEFHRIVHGIKGTCMYVGDTRTVVIISR